MGPSVRVKRRHAYASIQDDDRFQSEQLTDTRLEGGRRALSESGAAADPASPPLPAHDPSRLSSNYPAARRDVSRVNRLVRSSSIGFRSFDLDSNPSGSPPPTFSRATNILPQETIFEGTSADVAVPQPLHGHAQRVSRVRSALSSSPSRTGHESFADSGSNSDSDDEDRVMEDDEHHHDDDVVDHLDVIDPQVATVATLTNAANAILLPPISFYSRKPVVILPRTVRESDIEATSVQTTSTDELDRHVHDVLKRKNKFRRVMKGVWTFLKTPLGVIFGLYGFFVVFWGSALVLFLAKWINLHNQNTQDFWSEICQQILNGLFCLTGIGLMPWRIVDTYRMYKIWYYKRRTRKLRRKAELPELYDNNDLPDPIFDPNYVHVLTDKEEYELHHQQKKFMKSQTWYRPHGTETHRAFPINTALWICILNDGNTIFQCMLAACMWSMDRFQRPAWTTGVLLPLAFACGILSGVFIWRGGKKTKRTERVEERLRRALEMDDLDHGNQPDGVMARLQEAISRHSGGNKERVPVVSPSSQDEKGVEHYRGTANGTANRYDSLGSTVLSPGIRIEEEMVVPFHS